jgi:hypothetical protein
MAIPPTSFIKYDFSDPACYPGSGTTITDLNANLDGSTNGSPTFVSNGQQSYFQISSDSQKVWSDPYNFPTRNIYTISAIFQVPSQNLLNVILSLAQSNGVGTVPFFAVPNTGTNEFNFPFSSNGNAVNDITGNLKLQNNTWNMLTLTADGTTQKLYLNGVLVGSIAHTASFNGSTPRLQTGYVQNEGINALQKIAVIHMWESALTASQVKDLADSYATRFALYQPIVSYDFSITQSYSGSGSTVFDLASNVNATITNATYVSDGSASHFNFNGTNAVITSNLYDQSSKTVMTYNCWGLYSSTAVGYMFITGLGILGPSGGGSPVFAVNEATANEYRFNFGYGYGAVTAPSIINQWAMLTITADGTTVKFYIDGVLVDTASQGVGQIDSGPQRTRLGAFDTGGGFFAGKIATFDYYNVALEAADILSIYNSTAFRFSNVKASYDLNNLSSYPGTGNTLYDLSGNNADITLSNTSYFDSPTYDYNSLVFTKAATSIGTYSGSLGLGTTNPNFTFFMWVKPVDVTNGVNYSWFISYGKEDGALGGAPMILPYYAGSQNLSTGFGSGQALIQTGTGLTLNDWVSLATTCDGTTYKIYKNGAQIGSTTLSGAQIVAPEVLALNYLTGNPGLGTLDFEFNL